ncbi:hypothetical protein JYU16_00140 [bacterium AH-315-M05]|nr:hypothetical protein [bacterium AH-315-M05]
MKIFLHKFILHFFVPILFCFISHISNLLAQNTPLPGNKIQQQGSSQTNTWEKCGTMEAVENLKDRDTGYEKRLLQIEKQIRRIIQQQDGQKKMAAVITICVVFHVVYNNAGENISDAQLLSQLDVLNEDFRRLNPDTGNTRSVFKPVAADVEFEFCLAAVDPLGNPTTGITRTSTSHGPFTTNDDVKYDALGGKDIWDRDAYLNIWICDLSGGLLGYAYFPGAPADVDGVVIDYEYTGRGGSAVPPYDQGRTATHEVGHWFALYHTFQDGCVGTASATCAVEGDLCCDTPPTSSSNFGCPSPTQNTCTETPIDQIDQWENYMDYVDDACMNMFSEDQKTRMRAVIDGTRASLKTANCCNLLTLTMSSADALCSGSCDGEATVSVSGGTTPYTYLWNDPSSQTTATATGLCAGTYTVTVTDSNSVQKTDSVIVTEPPLLTISISGNNINCNGSCDGDATVSASGGTTPYTYSWNDPSSQTTATATGLCAGTYTVTVADANGCSVSDSIVITEPASPITTSISGNDAICSGICDGNATVAASGGTGAYTYLWDDPASQTTDTATGLCAGTYIVTVTDANNCSTADTITLGEAITLVLSTSSTGATCGNANGDASVSVSGGSSPYTYSWNDPALQTTATATGLIAGTYTVTVTDSNSCAATASVLVNDISGPDASILSSNNVSCNGDCDGSANVSVSGGTSPFTYLWDDPASQTTFNATGLCAGTYSITVTDSNGCTGSDSVTITESSLFTASSFGIGTSCNGTCNGSASVALSGGTSPFTYQWDDPSFQTTETATGLCAGTYTVTVTDANGCITSDSISIGEPAPVSLTTSITDATCGSTDGEASVSVAGGTSPYTYLWDDPLNQTTSTATGLAAGGYTVTVTDVNGCGASATVTINDIGGPTASISSFIDVSCNGLCDGEATVSVSGGTTPYTYLWDNGDNTPTADTLCAGTYSVTVTDANGCAAAVSIDINEPAALNSSITSINNTSCNGICDGDATVSVNGGTGAYTYLWNDPLSQTTATADSLCAGTYTVTVTDNNGCVTLSVAEVTEPAVLVANTTGSVAICDGCFCTGSVLLFPEGGTLPYSILWSNGYADQFQTGLCDGTYTVTLTDANGCTTTGSVTIP